MTQILSIITFLALLFYTATEVKFQLQMMQQNTYRNDRYNRWLKGESFASVSRLVDLFLLLLLSTNFLPLFVQIVAITVALYKSVNHLKAKYKKPLVFTRRATRLYVAALLLTLVIAGLSAATTTLNNGSRALLALAILAPYLMMIANWLMQPVEKQINRKYYNEAKQILAQMPGLTIIGITGSYGKTSTKHYLYRILCERYNVLMTPGSFNTPMGVIRTVREQMKPYHNVFICEMGAKQIGDIKEICDLVNPQIGIITAVGEQHLESFKSIENVQRTKFELVDALPASGFAVVNNDFPYIANRPVNNVPVKRYTIADTGADYHIENIRYDSDATRFTVVGGGERIELSTKLIGECNLSNLMAAVIVARHLQVPVQSIQYGVSRIEQVEHRLNMKRTPGGISIIDDAFNSNPDGARMALDVLRRMTQGKRIAITPGMIELGDKQVEYNRTLGRQLATACDYVMVVGRYNRDAILAGLQAENFPEEKLFVADSFAEAQARLAQVAEAGDTVLYENDLPDTFK